MVSVELRHPIPGSAQSLSIEPENGLSPPPVRFQKEGGGTQYPSELLLLGLCSWEAPLVSGLFPGKGESVGFRLPRSLPTTKRAIREMAMIMTINTRLARTSLDILGAAGATAEESRPVGETPVSRRRVRAGQS